MRVSTDAGQTFGLVINIRTNGTITIATTKTTDGGGNMTNTTTTITTNATSGGDNATDDFVSAHRGGALAG
jgi:hypothetical protein